MMNGRESIRKEDIETLEQFTHRMYRYMLCVDCESVSEFLTLVSFSNLSAREYNYVRDKLYLMVRRRR